MAIGELNEAENTYKNGTTKMIDNSISINIIII